MLSAMSQSPFSAVPFARHGGSHGRAASLVWAVAAVELLVSVCCIGGTYALPPSAAQFGELPPGIDAAQMVTLVRVVATVMVSLLFAAPAVALLFLGFPLRRGSGGARLATLIILWAHGVFVGITVLANLVQLAGDPLAAIVSLLLFGGLLTLIVAAIRAVHGLSPSARAAGPVATAADGDDFIEPWNSHLPR